MPEEDLHLSDQTRFQAHQPSLRDAPIFVIPVQAVNDLPKVSHPSGMKTFAALIPQYR